MSMRTIWCPSISCSRSVQVPDPFFHGPVATNRFYDRILMSMRTIWCPSISCSRSVQVPDPFFHGPVATNRFTMSLLSAGFTFALRQFIFVVFSNQDCQQHLDIKKPVILMYAILHACLPA